MSTVEDTPLQLSTDKPIDTKTKLSETFIYQIIPILLYNHYINLSDINVFRQLSKNITNTDPYVNQIIIKNSTLINLVELKRFINLQSFNMYNCKK